MVEVSLSLESMIHIYCSIMIAEDVQSWVVRFLGLMSLLDLIEGDVVPIRCLGWAL